MGDLIKKLRDLTGAGFVDCKKALESSNNNIDEAIKWLQKNGAAKAIKKQNNIAAEGIVAVAKNDKKAIIYEVNCQTDFVAMNDDFKKLVANIGVILLSNNFSNDNFLQCVDPISKKTIEELTVEATAKIGEKISLRRLNLVERKEGVNIGAYAHFDGKKAALFIAKGGTDDKLKGVAMHIVAMNPEYINEQQVPPNIIKELKDKFANSPALNGKPDKIKESILSGMLRKELSNNVLVEQEYVVESGKTIAQYLKEINATELEMIRYEVGEGIEKVEIDFASEVAAQMKK